MVQQSESFLFLDGTYLFVSPNRYVFRGAELIENLDESVSSLSSPTLSLDSSSIGGYCSDNGEPDSQNMDVEDDTAEPDRTKPETVTQSEVGQSDVGQLEVGQPDKAKSDSYTVGNQESASKMDLTNGESCSSLTAEKQDTEVDSTQDS